MANFTFDVQRTPAETVLTINGSLDINSAGQLVPTVDEIVASRPAKVIVELGGLDLIDSSGVAALIKLYKGVRNHSGDMTIANMRDQPLAIFKLLRMDRVFKL